MSLVAEERKLLPIKDAAYRLGISTRKFYELLSAGLISSVHIDARRLIPIESVDAYADSLEREIGIEEGGVDEAGDA